MVVGIFACNYDCKAAYIHAELDLVNDQISEVRAMRNIGVVVGSLSKRSYSQKIAAYLMNQGLFAKFVQIN